MIRLIKRYFIRRRTLPEAWLKILKSHVPYYSFLPNNLKEELHKHMPVIFEEKIFEGCGGLKMTEEKKIIIAAYATVLILGEPAGYYPDLKAILVYPDDYVAPVREEDESGIMTEGMEARSGESWDMGSIVLSWADIKRDLRQPFSGKNLIFHEFAHQFDGRYGITAGIDEFGHVHTPDEWNKTLAKSYLALQRSWQRGEPTLMDTYGATNPAEFFSVATETFFENAHRLRRHDSKLYDVLREIYNMDPASYLPYS